MARQNNAVHEALVNRNIILAAGVIVLVGAVMTWGGIRLLDVEGCPKWVGELTKELGTAAFGIGIIALMWELTARRAFMSEILATVDLSEDIEGQGIIHVSDAYLRVPWPEMFKETRTFDVFFSYARTWTNANALHLQEMADRPVPMRVLLPDPEDARVVGELALWYRTSADDIQGRIRGAIAHYTQLAGRPNAKIEMRLTKRCPLFTVYLFTQVVVFTTHSHRPAPTPVPTVIAKAGKPLYAFFQDEFNYLWAEATPPQKT